MTKIPEHPDIVKERKRERWAVVFGLRLALLFFGIATYSFAGYAK